MPTYFETTLIKSWLEEHPLPWLSYDTEKKKLIVVVDNHLLSTHRSCGTHYMLNAVEGQNFKPGFGVPNNRQWYLDFGIVFHKLVEYYYQNFRKDNFNVNEWAVDLAYQLWMQKELEVYKDHPEYKAILGLKGFSALLLQYAQRYRADNERLRIIATEVSFGKSREVQLFSTPAYEFYLAGRMDVLVDDGYFIMPMDHKTVGTFKRGDPLDRYLNDEGPTGYVYTLTKILPKYVPEELIFKRDCTRILMNLISKAWDVNAPADRFRRLTIYKTQEQLSQYQLRMVLSIEALLRDLITYINHGVACVPRDTSHCTNWYYGKCYFFDVCRQSSEEAMRATLSNGFVQLPVWDTENVSL